MLEPDADLRRIFSGSNPTGAIRVAAGAIPSAPGTWIEKRAAMNQLKTGEASEAAHSNSDLQKELAEVLRQRAAISAVLRAIANSPHDLQPIFDTILDSAVHLCRSEGGIFRLSEEIGFRLVAYKLDPAVSEWVPPKLREHSSLIGRLFGSKSPVQIPDLATYLERIGAVDEGDREAISRSVRTVLYVPMLRNDEIIGTLSLIRWRIEPFTENEIELVTDFAAQTAIAFEITSRERELREMQMELSSNKRITNIKKLSFSIADEVNQPISSASMVARSGIPVS